MPYEFPGCAVIISHDRWFLDEQPHILVEGNSHVEWFEGNYQLLAYEQDKKLRLGTDTLEPTRIKY